jgi:neutral ceramidase
MMSPKSWINGQQEISMSCRKPFHLGLLLILVLQGAGFLDAGGRSDPKKIFRAGAFAVDITPRKFPVSVNGGMTDRQASKAHDPLHARCLVLDDGNTRIAIVVCDSCMIPREILDEAKRKASKLTGIPSERMLISASHTHTAPTLGSVFQSDPDPDYVKYLPGKIAEGIQNAVKNLAPARIGWAVAKDPTQVFNRRWKMKPGTIDANPFGGPTDKVRMNPGYQAKGLIEPAGPTDPEVSIVSLQSPDGRPIALLANYSLHYVGGVPALSADYFAAFAERMTQLLDARKSEPAFVGIMSNGTSGDINNINFAGPMPKSQGPYEQARIVANSVSKAAHQAYKTIKHKDWVELKMAQKEIELGVRLPTAADVERARGILAKAKSKVLQKLPEIYANETVHLAKYPAKVKIILQAIKIGDLGIVANPCETFVEIGLEIKKKSPLRPTFTIELANGYNGYLPTPEQHKLGGYETWRARSSYLEVDAATKITATLLDLLNQVAR